MIMLKQARLIEPSTKIDAIKDILIAERKIIKIDDDLSFDAPYIARAKGEKLQIIDCTNKVVAPGLIDIHVNFPFPKFSYREDLYSIAKAGLRGGYTHLVGMACGGNIVDNEAGILYILKEGSKVGINIKTMAAISKNLEGKELVDMKLLKDCGAISFSDEYNSIDNYELCKEAMKKAKKLNMILSLHEENKKFIVDEGINAGEISKRLGLTGSYKKAEFLRIERDCKLAKEQGCGICIQHISTKESVDIIRKYQTEGVKIFASVNPIHFSLSQEDVLKYNSLAKIIPPLRDKNDINAIIEGIKASTINILTSEHTPCSKKEKNSSFKDSLSGMIGLETSLSLGIMNLVDPGYITLMDLMALMSYNPAKIYNIDAGIIKEDKIANLIVFDPCQKWKYKTSYSKSSNSPFLGQMMKGKILLTISNGLIEYSDL